MKIDQIAHRPSVLPSRDGAAAGLCTRESLLQIIQSRVVLATRHGHAMPAKSLDEFLKCSAGLWGKFIPSFRFQYRQAKWLMRCRRLARSLQRQAAWIATGFLRHGNCNHP